MNVTHLNSTERSHAAAPHLQVRVALQFFASGTFQLICGDRVHVSQSSASHYIQNIALGLKEIYHQFVSMPSQTDETEVKLVFANLLIPWRARTCGRDTHMYSETI